MRNTGSWSYLISLLSLGTRKKNPKNIFCCNRTKICFVWHVLVADAARTDEMFSTTKYHESICNTSSRKRRRREKKEKKKERKDKRIVRNMKKKHE